MSEISEQFAKRQFNKFAGVYKKLRGVNLVWHSYNTKQSGGWDFSGIDTNNKDSILCIEYTEGIVNKTQKANIEKQKRGKYKFKYAHGIRPFTEVVEKAYGQKLKKADKNFVLLVGFHDIFYDKNDKYDAIESISPYMKKKYRQCAYKEVWIINEADNSCDLVFE